MEIAFSKSVIPCLKQLLCKTTTQEQTQELRLGDGMPDAGKILGCWGQLLTRGKQWRDRNISMSAGCMIWVLYAPEDGSQPQMMEGYVPIQMQWDLPEQKDHGEIRVGMRLASMDARILSPRKLMVRLQVSAQVKALVPEKVESFEDQDVPEDVQLLKRTYPVNLLCCAGEKMVNPEERYSLPEAEKVLSYQLCPMVTETKLSAGRLLMKGLCKIKLLCQGKDGKLFSESFDLPFSQLADVDGEYEDNAAVDVIVCPTTLEVEQEADGQLKARSDLVCQYVISQRREITLVEDAYSNLRELTPVTQALQLPACLDDFQENVSAELPWEAENRETVDCSVWMPYPGLERYEEDSNWILTASCQVLSYDREGQLHSDVLSWEDRRGIPAAEGCKLCTSIRELDPPKPHHGSIGIDLELRGKCMGAEEKTVISGLELGEEKEPDASRPSLVLRRAGERELWDLAKTYGSTVDAIRQANDLSDAPAADVFLLIPVL